MQSTGVAFTPSANAPATLVIANLDLAINNSFISLQTNAPTHLLIRWGAFPAACLRGIILPLLPCVCKPLLVQRTPLHCPPLLHNCIPRHALTLSPDACSNGTAAIANSNFLGNRAAQVGVLQAEAAAALILYNSYFSNNQVCA